jgi:hypothetical protein
VPRGSRHGTGAFGMVRRETLLDSSPYAPGTSSSLSWSSGYIEGKAFRNGFIATPPGSRVPLRKNALAAEPCAVPLRSTPQLRAQRHRNVLPRWGGSNFDAD